MDAVLEKPRFSVDQLTSATDAAKKFAEVRRRAKSLPQFITEHNTVDSVILSYEDYEAMYAELIELREREILITAAERIAVGDANPLRKSISLQEAMSDEEYADYLACEADDISDEDLFE